MSIVIHSLKYLRRDFNICDLFRAASYDTWERIAFSRTRPRMKIQETTITQNLVYEMNLFKWTFGIGGFSIYESTNEAAHGDDLEICVLQQSGHVYKYAVQAKILYHSLRNRNSSRPIRLDDGKYDQFKHTSGGRNQIDLLLEFAAREGYIPIYLLYNYVSATALNGAYCSIDFDVTQMGCSIVSAHYLKNHHSNSAGNLKGSVRFSHLHTGRRRYALPWFVLPCCFPGFNLEQVTSALGLPENFSARSFDIQEVEQDNNRWNLLGPIAETRTNSNKDFKQDQVGFLPKYRFVIGTAPVSG